VLVRIGRDDTEHVAVLAAGNVTHNLVARIAVKIGFDKGATELSEIAFDKVDR